MNGRYGGNGGNGGYGVWALSLLLTCYMERFGGNGEKGLPRAARADKVVLDYGRPDI